MQDIRGFFRFVTERYPDDPHFLYGHSLGGLLVLTYVLQSRIVLKDVVVTGAALRSPIHDQKVKISMAKVLGSVAPSMLLSNGLVVTDISHDPAVITAYQNDPLVHDRVSLGFGKSGLGATEYVWKHAEEFALPLLIMHGTEDRITYPSGSRDFVELASKHNQDVTLKLWDGMYHEVHNEPHKEQVFEYMIDWLEGHS